MGKRSIAGEFTKSLLAGTLVLVTLTGAFWVLQTYRIFKSEEIYLTANEQSSAKTLAKSQVQQAINNISYQEEELISRINQQVQSRVNEGVQQARAIMAQNQGKSTEETQRAVINGLRGLRFFEDRGYYFIGTLQGQVILYPLRPELEGTNITNVVDAKGQRIADQETAIAQTQGEGFVSAYWPHPQNPGGESRLKISYVKRLEPYDWFIGTGEFYDDFKAAVQQDILERYSRYSFSNGARVFIISDSGEELVSRYAVNPNEQGPQRTEEEKQAVISEELEYAVANKAGYGYMRTYTQPDGSTYETAVYIKPVPEWGWVVGAEVPVTAMRTEANMTPGQVRQRSLETLVQIIAAIVIVFIASVMVMRRQSHRLRNDFMAFMAFFKRAAKENVLIEIEDIQMQEFASMANMANQMVAKRQEAENALMAANEDLELQVQERTQELQESLLILESTQEQVVENEKLSVLGNLVTGIAHEINVPMGIVRSLNTDMQELLASIRSTLQDDETGTIALQALLTRMDEDAAMMEANLKRTVELVEDFKQASVDQANGQRRKINLRSYISKTILSLSSRIKKGNHHVEIICDNTVEIIGFPGILSQIITNLVMNSLQHGFKNRTGGHITLEVIDGGQRILLLYRDDGCGIPARSINRVYEPFFSTDRDRSGSGLGLNIVHQLVTEKLGGVINLTSIEGRGVLFEIEFPRVQEA